VNDADRVTFDRILSELRRRDFGILWTVAPDGRPHSAGVVYGLSLPGRPFQLCVMRRRRLRKARNLAENPDVSFVVPLTRWLLWFLPPPCIQFQAGARCCTGTAPAARRRSARSRWAGGSCRCTRSPPGGARPGCASCGSHLTRRCRPTCRPLDLGADAQDGEGTRSGAGSTTHHVSSKRSLEAGAENVRPSRNGG
jgi:hypothetical protein